MYEYWVDLENNTAASKIQKLWKQVLHDKHDKSIHLPIKNKQTKSH